MTIDLEQQVRDYVSHADSLVGLVAVEELTSHVQAEIRLGERRGSRAGLHRKPGVALGWGVAVAAAAAVILAIGGALWLVRSTPGQEVVDTPSPSVPVVSAAPSVTQAPGPFVTVTPAPSPAIPYADVGERIGSTEVSLGSIEWWSLQGVPVALVNEGNLPSPWSTWPSSWTALYEAAPEGVEIFEVASGYVGLDVEDSPLPPLDSEFKDRNREWTPDTTSYFLAGGIWFSADGESWESMSDGPIEPDMATIWDPFVVAERDGRYVMVGWADSETVVTLWDDQGNVLEDGEGNAIVLLDSQGNAVEIGDAFDPEGNLVDIEDLAGALDNGELTAVTEMVGRGRPMAWASDDLVSWERVVADFDKPGMRTDLTSVVATDQGWLMFGVRATEDVALGEHRTAEWVAWASPDGKVWEEFPIQDLLGAPECTPTLTLQCVRIKGERVPGGVAVYAYEWSVSGGPPGVEQGRTPGYRVSVLVGLPG